MAGVSSHRWKRLVIIATVGAGLGVIAWQVRVRLAIPPTVLDQNRAAVAMMEKAAAAQPSNISFQLRLASAYTRVGRWEEAEKIAIRACQEAPGVPQAWMALGDLALHQEHYLRSGRAYQQAVTLAPNDCDVLCALGQLELERGHLSHVHELVIRAEKANPMDSEPHLLQARLLLRTTMVDMAIPELQQAVKLRPDHLRAWLELAETDLQASRIPDAEAACQSALRIEPSNPDALSLLAQVEMEKGGEGEEARRLAEKALEVDPGHASAHYILGLYYLRANRVVEAVPHLEAAVNADPARLDARANLVKAYQRSGRSGDAERQLTLLQAAAEYDKKAHALAARSQVRPNDAELHLQLAKLYDSVGGDGKAALEYERTLEIDPHCQAALQALKRLGAE